MVNVRLRGVHTVRAKLASGRDVLTKGRFPIQVRGTCSFSAELPPLPLRLQGGEHLRRPLVAGVGDGDHVRRPPVGLIQSRRLAVESRQGIPGGGVRA